MYKAKKRIKRVLVAPSDAQKCEQACAQPVPEKLLAQIRAQLTTLPTCSSQDINTRVGEYLTHASGNDLYMLDAWEKCGRADFKRGLPVKFQNVCREVLTALGIACLIRYARGYLDEAEAHAAIPHRAE